MEVNVKVPVDATSLLCTSCQLSSFLAVINERKWHIPINCSDTFCKLCNLDTDVSDVFHKARRPTQSK